MSNYPKKYSTLIDDETWRFIKETEKWYPPDAINLSIEEKREIYNKMCREFFAGYPEGVSASDGYILNEEHKVPIRQYVATPDKPKAEIIYYHGGGFVVGGLDSHDDVCAELCSATGYRVTSVDYRLAPEFVFPDDFSDALAAFNAIAAQSTLPIVLVGDSAGGNLAAAVSHASRKEKTQPVGQVLIYPGLNNNLTQGTFIEHAEAPMLTTADTTFYKTVRTGGDEIRLKNPLCTPLSDEDFSNLPPTVSFAAQCDPLCGDSQAYCDAIDNSGGKALSINETGLVHGYLRGRHTVKRARDSFERIKTATKLLGQNKWPVKFD